MNFKSFFTFILICSTTLFAQWNAISPPNSYTQPIAGGSINQIALCDDSTGIFLFYGGGIKTNDGGKNLFLYTIPQRGIITSLKININNDFVLFKDRPSEYGGLDTTIIYKSTDRGITWNLKAQLPSRIVIYDMEISPNGELYAVGNSGWGYSEIYKSTDSGETWIKIFRTDSTQSIRLYTVQFVNNLVGFIYGDGITYRTNDAGLHWDTSNLIPAETKKYIWSDINHGFIITIYNKLKRTVDGGVSWIDIDLVTNERFIDIIFIDSQTGWLCTPSKIYKTTDFGVNWEQETTPSFSSSQPVGFEKLYFYKKIVWVAGYSGIILSREEYTTGVERITLPGDYSLSQNYPNPFNPSTTIKFSIPNFQFAILKVYDILGREITTLVNEDKAPGNYEVKFNGNNFSSGIYFYRLQSGNFRETKKFVLMK